MLSQTNTVWAQVDTQGGGQCEIRPGTVEVGYTGYHFWARGYCVSTVGLDEQTIRAYIRNQEAEQKRQDDLDL